jgi:hypothetical protein
MKNECQCCENSPKEKRLKEIALEEKNMLWRSNSRLLALQDEKDKLNGSGRRCCSDKEHEEWCPFYEGEDE